MKYIVKEEALLTYNPFLLHSSDDHNDKKRMDSMDRKAELFKMD